MPYSTTSDVQIAAGGMEKLIELSDQERQDCVDETVVARAIADADAMINTYVHKRYGVDLQAPIPPTVISLSADEAVFRMKTWRNMVSEADMELHQRRVDLLQAFAEGDNTLGVSPQPAKSELVTDRAVTRTSNKAIGREKLKGFW